MKNLWNSDEAAKYPTDRARRVYTSRLLGRDHRLVLHGGGNTSVKLVEKNLHGESEEILYVKGSGWDLETIEEQGFSPVRLQAVRRLAELPVLTDPDMMNALATQMTRTGAPAPSVETILHAILPYKFVDHTHADALLAVTNTADGEAKVREIYGDDVVVIPYVMPGFDLAQVCAERFGIASRPSTSGMVLLNHGIFSFGDTAEQSYSRMIDLVSRAEKYLERKGALLTASDGAGAAPAREVRLDLARLRFAISRSAGAAMIVSCHADGRYLSFARRADVADVTQRGPATPDHVLRTKRVPMIGRDVPGYERAYREYFERHAPAAKEKKSMLDPAPRVVLDPELGLCCVGRTVKDANIVFDLYHHTIDVIEAAEALGGYRALPERDIFDVEYWDLEQAKLRKASQPPHHAGEVVLITGAASGIGKACVERFLRSGAAVIGLDIDPRVVETLHRPDYLGVHCDVTDEAALGAALEAGARAFGGIDMLVLNAGIFPGGRSIDALDADAWRQVMSVNVDSNVALMRLAYPLLKLAPNGGRVVVIGSKNVPAPGPGAAAYSASKAALTQLSRVAALEWGGAGIRVNTIHPNAVFDTGIWTDEVLNARAAHYGMTVDEYKRNNVLKTDVTSADVAEMIIAMCGPAFSKTTGAQVPVDGGNDRVI
jgi:rhamnose utilization protein RhaD (predicted bifunctional aldolase and dehydrogenase)/NAD(P)-dependent dehydrogenase (short-subunit alcohol dehydrogenase family)